MMKDHHAFHPPLHLTLPRRQVRAMTVFIGYRHSDRLQAQRIKRQLHKAGIEAHLDVMDFDSLSTLHVIEVLTQHISRCTHLLLMVSGVSAKSWWVPFEIGQATVGAQPVCCFQMGEQELPPYLQHWPTLTRLSQLEFFIEAYHRSQAGNPRALGGGHEAERAQNPAEATEDFHKRLKARIFRGY